MSDAEALDWVTEQQQAEMERVMPGGAWRTWLPQALDVEWPEWRTEEPQELVPLLDRSLSTMLGSIEPSPTEDS